jgi:hypothetical protein
MEQMIENLLAKMGAEMKAQIGSLVSWMDSHYEEMEVKLNPNEREIKASKEEILANMNVWNEEIKASQNHGELTLRLAWKK